MSDFSSQADRVAAQQIAERVATAERLRIPGRLRPHGRHALASRLHRWADRLDA
jgi:hypothetical protein